MRSSVLVLGLIVSSLMGCGSPPTTSGCDPGCAVGTHCDGARCVADAMPADMSVVVVAADLAHLPCFGRCAGATPFCGGGEQCVPCLVNTDCPVGNVCAKVGSGAACLAGCDDDTRCAPMGPTFHCCGDACLSTDGDAYNCGACGKVCGAIHAAVKCVAGQCMTGACDAGWDDCNHDATDGCETNLRIDPAHCGACGTVCSTPHGVAACAGACYIAACGFGYDDCNGDAQDGCETPVTSDVLNCGMCNHACVNLPHASPGCSGGACVIQKCDQGWLDCDGQALDGCEVSALSDSKNCGQCGTACAMGLVCKNGGCTCPNCNFANAKSMCVNFACVMGDCNPGYADCNASVKDGCEVSLGDDAMNCGKCGAQCPRNLPSCTSGVCSVCGTTLANVGAGDFHISFNIQTNAAVESTVVYQRAVCNHGMFWDVRMTPAGLLSVEVDDNNVRYASGTTRVSVNDGGAHAVLVERLSGVLHVLIDGVEDINFPSLTNLGALSPLGIAKGDPCEFQDATRPMVGTVSGVCLTVP